MLHTARRAEESTAHTRNIHAEKHAYSRAMMHTTIAYVATWLRACCCFDPITENFSELVNNNRDNRKKNEDRQDREQERERERERDAEIKYE